MRISLHAATAMFEDGFTRADLERVLATALLLENYPGYYRGPCCLLYGDTSSQRPMHIVCSTAGPIAVIITAYEPTLPKWLTPTRRRG